MGYLGYYFAWLAFSYLIRQPWLLVGLVVLWLLRGLVPPPGALFGALSRAGRLREQVRVNRANVTARRDLATIYIDVLRPARAVQLLEEGLLVSPGDAELLYLQGLALHRAGRNEAALPPLLAAIEKDQRLRHGAPYFVAGNVLLAQKRWDDAVDAFERYQDFNSSDVAAHTALARAYAGSGDAASARKWLLAGLQTWHGLPGAMKRRQLGAYLKAQWARVTVLKDAGAVLVALFFAAGIAAAGVANFPLIVGLWRPEDKLLVQARDAWKACGSQRTGTFEGEYEVTVEPAPGEETIVIERDRIDVGQISFCLSKVLERKSQSLHAQAMVHTRREPGEAPAPEADDFNLDSDEQAALMLYDVRLDGSADLVRMRVAPLSRPMEATTYRLRRKAEGSAANGQP